MKGRADLRGRGEELQLRAVEITEPDLGDGGRPIPPCGQLVIDLAAQSCTGTRDRQPEGAARGAQGRVAGAGALPFVAAACGPSTSARSGSNPGAGLLSELAGAARHRGRAPGAARTRRRRRDREPRAHARRVAFGPMPLEVIPALDSRAAGSRTSRGPVRSTCRVRRRSVGGREGLRRRGRRAPPRGRRRSRALGRGRERRSSARRERPGGARAGERRRPHARSRSTRCSPGARSGSCSDRSPCDDRGGTEDSSGGTATGSSSGSRRTDASCDRGAPTSSSRCGTCSSGSHGLEVRALLFTEVGRSSARSRVRTSTGLGVSPYSPAPVVVAAGSEASRTCRPSRRSAAGSRRGDRAAAFYEGLDLATAIARVRLGRGRGASS